MTKSEITTILHDILSEFKPVFEKHGGGAEVVAIESDAVILRLKGKCNDCALAPLTFGLGIERLIKQRIPSITQVKYTN